MKIAVNTRMLLAQQMEGIGWFAHETLRRITQNNSDHTFYFLFDRPYNEQFIYGKNIIPVTIPIPARHPILWQLYFQQIMPWVLKRIKPDLFFSPEGYMPPGGSYKKIITMHDIAYEHFPESVPPNVLKYYQQHFRSNSLTADRILTVSEFSKGDLIANYGLSPEKISVVYNGYHSEYHPLSEDEKEVVRNQYTEGHPYFIFIGSIQPRKNILWLMQAFNAFRKANEGYKLILGGKRAYKAQDLDALKSSLEYGSEIIFTGRVPEVEEVNRLLGAATALTYVPLLEGFGIPCIEAMRAGVPLIASHTSALPEVCGSATYYVNPYSIPEIAAAMQTLASDNELRQKLIAEGFEQVKKFSWDKTANLVWEALMSNK